MQTQGQNQSLTLAVIGDIHDQWEDRDARALEALGIDLVLFVGDVGNEAVGLVRAIAQLSLPKAVILGNHDAWYSATPWGRKKCPYDRRVEDRVQQQLDFLGVTHVGYGCLDFPDLNVSVVGSRPFSWGGPKWQCEDFYGDRYGINGFEDSITRMVDSALAATCDRLIFLAHCGPTGLGSQPEDPCGKDWHPIGGDYGDPDLAQAIAQVQARGMVLPLVAFGHMHHRLRHRTDRTRRSLHVDTQGTVYVNAAHVPRIVQTPEGARRNFSLVQIEGDRVTWAALIWVDDALQIVSEEELYCPPYSVMSMI